MSWKDYELGGAFAFVHAGAISVLSLGLFVTHPGALFTLWTPLFLGSCTAAWLGWWAWQRGRWLVAAGAFLLALAWPGGFIIGRPEPGDHAFVITGSLVIGLMFVSLFRACIDHPARKRRVAHGHGR